MTIAHHHRHHKNQRHKIPDERTILLVLMGLGVAASGAVGWIRVQQVQAENIQQAQAQLTTVCEWDINSPASAIAASNQVDESIAQLQRVPRVPGLGYQTAQAQLERFAPCAQNVQATADFFTARQLSEGAMAVTGSTVHSATEWRRLQANLDQAIALLRGIPEDADFHTAAQQELQLYQTQRGEIHQRFTYAAEAETALAMAEQLHQSANQVLAGAADDAAFQEAENQLRSAIQWLETIPPGHAVSGTAQARLIAYQQQLGELHYQQAVIELQTLVNDFYYFTTSLNVMLSYPTYADQLNQYNDRFYALIQMAPNIVDHPAAQSLQTALNQSNEAMVVWRYCYEGNCYTSWEANILDLRGNLLWIPATFQLGDRYLAQAYSVPFTNNIWLQSYVEQDLALTTIWESARQNAVTARDAFGENI
ncbi:hypothetical protein [Egbenema bharatensis]|uniref:hypothetical protein n=1 Tax=Egbenema bharatensis TaxID=3463334 RepID=UPI003A86FE7F